jgi:hypothetical protein
MFNTGLIPLKLNSLCLKLQYFLKQPFLIKLLAAFLHKPRFALTNLFANWEFSFKTQKNSQKKYFLFTNLELSTIPFK